MSDLKCQYRKFVRWDYVHCGAPLKTDEQREAGLCARHLAGKKASERNEQKRQEQAKANSAAYAKAKATAQQMTERFGVKFTAIEDFFGRKYYLRVELEDAEGRLLWAEIHDAERRLNEGGE